MGLSPSRGGPLPLPRTHLSSSPQGRVQPDTAGKMAATAPAPIRGSPSARPPGRSITLGAVSEGRAVPAADPATGM
ncbi:hypothetical protein NDU88_004824 [Pleurodeles waltl]|uniref:Uncharacterized protein n=1 Tax=Pleurodeles waltl TaxID=8319 RepID=A0AAV7WVH0_PLEWA|nr:hypothetical protein NDU88_004824 [Pleurodeles waltl]